MGPLSKRQMRLASQALARRLLGRFRQAGYVGSKTGVGGGWALEVDPKQISLLDVLRAVEPQHAIFALHRSEPNQECPVGCHIQGVLTEIYAEAWDAMARRLARSSIADVAEALRVRVSSEG